MALFHRGAVVIMSQCLFALTMFLLFFSFFYVIVHVEIRPKWMEHIRDGLLRNFDCNVILVDWYPGNFPPYIQAAGNTRLMGAMIAELIKFLISQTQGSADLFHVVGFSLGSHIAGYTGRTLQQKRLTLGRITGNPFRQYFLTG